MIFSAKSFPLSHTHTPIFITFISFSSLSLELILPMLTKKKHRFLRKVTLKLSGCSSSFCRKPNTIISDVFNPKPRTTKTTTTYNNNNYFSSATSSKTTTFSNSESSTTTTTPGGAADMESLDRMKRRSLRGGHFGRVGEESVAIEKDSNDPYLDFRRSMLQMILENEIYSKDDLKQLLNCFLQLNSPDYHGIIVRAFSEIWNGLF